MKYSRLLSLFLIACLSQVNLILTQCVMKGICDRGAFGPIPCPTSSGPDPVTDEEAKDVLSEVCPHLANEAALCCDKDQILEMKHSFELYGLFLKPCAACYQNYQKLLCHLYCSPEQAKFSKILKLAKNDENNQDEILEVDYIVHNDFAQGIYDSCKNVTKFGERVINMFCKPWSADKCNAERMLKFLGADDHHYGHHPFQIDFIFTSASSYDLDGQTFTPVNAKTYKCNEETEGKPACECEHCPAKC